MDRVVEPTMAVKMSELGGLGVLNIEGVHGRYENSGDILEQMLKPPRIRTIYQEMSGPDGNALISSTMLMHQG